MNRFTRIFPAMLLAMLVFRAPVFSQTVRVPAEWEPQTSTWMQWPKGVEVSYRPNFSLIIDALQDYETVNIIVSSKSARTQAQNFLLGQGVPLTNITWHIMSYNWAWMRDNGPVWVESNGAREVQNWGFDAWGGKYPPWKADDAVPCKVAAIAGVPCKTFTLINERGNLEFNGAGALITSWPVFSDRVPGMSQAVIEAQLKSAFGLNQVVWLLSAPSTDVITNGHVDGIARFIDENTVVVARHVDQTHPDYPVYEEAATIIQNAGFDVLRLDIPGTVPYKGVQMEANYVNWLVVNDAVIICGFGVPAWDNAAKAAVEGFFPGRDVVVVKVLELWYWGGGVHCVTNDQPALATSKFSTLKKVDELETPTPSTFALEQNYPNPFNPSTIIRFQLPEAREVALNIYNSSGQRVRQLLSAFTSAGSHTIEWNGTDDKGKPVASGIYYYRIKAGEFSQMKKMLLMR